MTFHFTGCLLEWAEKNRPEIIDIVKGLTARGQVEMISGGFYEPILPSIPERDRLGQIRMLNDYIKKVFLSQPKGAWVAERVWEPALPSVLSKAGIKYTVLDDTHFLYAGLKKEDTYCHYITEDCSNTVAVFPSDKTLRYHIPYKMPRECMDYMRDIRSRVHDPLFVYGDDGEKFGEWPGTHKWVYEEKWLEKFFSELKKNSDWLDTVTLSECYEKRKPGGRIYIPTVSYEEMLEWALPAEIGERFEGVMNDIRNSGKEEWYKPFIRGGFWRNFFTKYPESNNMNKKMIYVSNKLEEMRGSKHGKTAAFGEAEKELFRGQCNCAYWHGVFGGLYLFHLRRAIYEHLVRSEAIMDSIVYGKGDMLTCDVRDVDSDGHDEIVLENRKISLYLDPDRGGSLKELDLKTVPCNLINSLSRRKEVYHKKIKENAGRSANDNGAKARTIHDGIQQAEAGIESHLSYDNYDRVSLVDHFMEERTEKETFKKCEHKELGDFVLGEYVSAVEKKEDDILVKMIRDGNINGISARVEKTVTLTKKGEGFKAAYNVKNNGEDHIRAVFAPEINITMPDADSERYEITINGKSSGAGLKDDMTASEMDSFLIMDHKKEVSLKIEANRTCGLWAFPVRTVSQSEKAYELNYQSTAVIPRVHLDLAPGKIFSFCLDIEIISA